MGTVKKELEIYGGNAPVCLRCGNWNAMLDDKVIVNGDYFRAYKCRDCGFVIEEKDVVLVYFELDRPGMGNESTYTEVSRTGGE